MDEDDLPQSTPELLAHYADGGPVDAAYRFLRAVLEDADMAVGWRMMDPNLRLVAAQAWLWVNRAYFSENVAELAELAAGFIGDGFERDPLWPAFAETQLREFKEAYAEAYAADLGAESHPRPIGVDLELVLLIRTNGEVLEFSGPTPVFVDVMMLMRTPPMAGGWLAFAIRSQSLDGRRGERDYEQASIMRRDLDTERVVLGDALSWPNTKATA